MAIVGTEVSLAAVVPAVAFITEFEADASDGFVRVGTKELEGPWVSICGAQVHGYMTPTFS